MCGPKLKAGVVVLLVPIIAGREDRIRRRVMMMMMCCVVVWLDRLQKSGRERKRGVGIEIAVRGEV
jgi:Ca2+/Na+ antiporter